MIQPFFEYKVLVRCITYNHSKYITDTLNGFCMQKTDFKYVCVIIDDSSKDDEQSVILDYLDKHFDNTDSNIYRQEETEFASVYFARHKENHNCFFLILNLKYNHNSIHKSKLKYIQQWTDNSPYKALCEGDDYWIDPYKLQKQTDFMDAHSDYSMCITNAEAVRDGKVYWTFNCYDEDSDFTIEDIITKGGAYTPTPSYFFRSDIYLKYPEELKHLYVGDYPLTVWMAYNGKVRYMSDVTCHYRYASVGSWSATVLSASLEKRKTIWPKEIEMHDALDKITNYKYHNLFEQNKLNFMFSEYYKFRMLNEARATWKKLKNPLAQYGFKRYLEINGLILVKDFIKRIIRK